MNVNPVEATAVKIEPEIVELPKGSKKRLSVEFTPSNATDDVVWTSSDPEVATVDAKTGEVTAVASGTATIKVQADKVAATRTVKVIE